MSEDEFNQHWSAGYDDFKLGKIDEATFWQRIEQSLGHALSDEKYQVWLKSSAIYPWQEMIDFIEELHEQGIETALLSDTVRPLSQMIRQKGGYKSFSPVILSDEVGLAKPNPAIYQMMLDTLGFKAQDCLFVDDKPYNLVPAKDLGIEAILASNSHMDTIKDIKRTLKEHNSR